MFPLLRNFSRLLAGYRNKEEKQCFFFQLLIELNGKTKVSKPSKNQNKINKKSKTAIVSFSQFSVNNGGMHSGEIFSIALTALAFQLYLSYYWIRTSFWINIFKSNKKEKDKSLQKAIQMRKTLGHLIHPLVKLSILDSKPFRNFVPILFNKASSWASNKITLRSI